FGPGILENDLEEIKNLFLNATGKTPVIFELKNSDSEKVKLILGKEYHIEPNEPLIRELENILGKDRIIFTPTFNNHPGI
ncbi:MAG: hypothetical protein NTZ48_04855, partial [Candidatus Omnitrophica bacterium]|nr:hypothetical protein [Candidatus Omnitrophota bacterium]